MHTLKKILGLLTPHELRRGFILLGMVIVRALLDTVGVASIMPFMSVLGNPDVVHTNRWLNMFYEQLGFTETRSFLIFLGGIFFAFQVGSITFKGLTYWALLRFTFMREYSLSCRMLRGYLGRPYVWFLNRHSADLGKSVLSEVRLVVKKVFIPAIELIAQGFVVFFIIILLVIVEPLLALTVTVVLGGAYLIIFFSIRRYLSRIGADRVTANRERFQVAQEALGGIKEVKIFGREKAFFERFEPPSFRFVSHQANGRVAERLPKYALEIVGFGGILLLAIYLLRTQEDVGRLLPLLSLYAFAGYRLMPALQIVYEQATKLRFGLPALDALYDDIVQCRGTEADMKTPPPPALIPQKNIALKDVRFSYPGAEKPALTDINLDIPVNSTVGLVGSTGSGKTSMVDIMMGLLAPDSGRLIVDNTVIKPENVRAWQRAIGYVPQQIYLADDTLAANIAFGAAHEEIDSTAVEHAARMAKIHDFVVNDLPDGYGTYIGERGIRLSGGQRQRVGIARALYHDPAVLFFDEATSALDNITEGAVISGILGLTDNKTLVIIAHRLKTVQDCDTIVMIEDGRVTGQGTYEKLLLEHPVFCKLAEGLNE